jgi:tRNA threonylcarbamoyladenosine modification (KEOPS) complex  Pcc1 subunit
MYQDVKISASLRINLSSETASALYKALEADNKEIPSDMKISMDIKGDSLEIYIECRGLGRLRNTLEDLMRCIHSILKLADIE